MNDNGARCPTPRAGAPGDRPRPTPTPTDGGFNEAPCLKGLGGDRHLLAEIAAAFLAYGPTTLAEAADALGRGDADALARTAHTLKGALANFRAAAPIEAADALERCARDGELPAAADALAALQHQLDLLLTALAPLAARSDQE